MIYFFPIHYLHFYFFYFENILQHVRANIGWSVGGRRSQEFIILPLPHTYMYLQTLCHILQYINHTFLMYLHTVPYITYMYLHTVPYIYHTFTYTLHCHILQYIIQLYTYTLHYHALQYTYFHPIPLPIHPLLAPRCYIHLKWRLRRKLF